MKTSIIGGGYVGLVTGAGFAKLGYDVIVVEADEKKVEIINNGHSPFYEEGLDELLSSTHIRATSDILESTDSELIFICVGTPLNNDGHISLQHVAQAAKELGRVLKQKKGYCVVCVKSTVPPRTTQGLLIPILEESGKQAGADFGICMSPEFLSEGKAIHDFFNPARIIIGEYDKNSGDRLASLYQDFKTPIMRTDLATAEMIKLASNAFLATKISFIGEIGNICKGLGVDVFEVARGMSFDDRIGNKFLNAGIGFGGSCLPKDVSELILKAKELDYTPDFLDAVLSLNNQQPLRLVELIKKHISLKGATIGILGLSFKPGTDDIRDSRAIEVVKALLKEGAIIKAYDPIAVENCRRVLPQISYITREEISDCDTIVILTEWAEFHQIDYTGKTVIDGRRIDKAIKEARIYEGICW